MTDIKISYQAVDGYRESRKFKTLVGAQKYAAKWVGEAPELGRHYAASGDGVGTVYAEGVPVADLFPKLKPAPEPEWTPDSWGDRYETTQQRERRERGEP